VESLSTDFYRTDTSGTHTGSALLKRFMSLPERELTSVRRARRFSEHLVAREPFGRTMRNAPMVKIVQHIENLGRQGRMGQIWDSVESAEIACPCLFHRVSVQDRKVPVFPGVNQSGTGYVPIGAF